MESHLLPWFTNAQSSYRVQDQQLMQVSPIRHLGMRINVGTAEQQKGTGVIHAVSIFKLGAYVHQALQSLLEQSCSSAPPSFSCIFGFLPSVCAGRVIKHKISIQRVESWGCFFSFQENNKCGCGSWSLSLHVLHFLNQYLCWLDML